MSESRRNGLVKAHCRIRECFKQCLQALSLCRVVSKWHPDSPSRQHVDEGGDSKRDIARLRSWKQKSWAVDKLVARGHDSEFWCETDCVLNRRWKIVFRDAVDDRKQTIGFFSEDGGVEIWVSEEVAKRHAQIAWDDFIRDTPHVIRAGTTCGKSLLPAYVDSYLAANNIALHPKLTEHHLGDKGMLSTEPSAIVAPINSEGWCPKQVVEDRSD